MNYGNIKEYDVADGEGVRVTLFVSGCTHHCKGCFQPETWNFSYGQPYTEETEKYILEKLSPGYISGLTLLGGEPFEPENQTAVLPLLRKVKELYPDKTVWAYSGYLMDRDIAAENGRAHCEATDEFLQYIDVLVDGEFVEERKSLTIPYRGSDNQRILDVKQSLEKGMPVEYSLHYRRK